MSRLPNPAVRMRYYTPDLAWASAVSSAYTLYQEFDAFRDQCERIVDGLQEVVRTDRLVDGIAIQMRSIASQLEELLRKVREAYALAAAGNPDHEQLMNDALGALGQAESDLNQLIC